jgi:hypothetical protein
MTTEEEAHQGTAAAMKGFKYAIAFLEDTHDDGAEIDLGDGLLSFEASLPKLVEASELSHWKEWLGSLAWKEVATKRRVISTRIPTARPNVSDPDNEAALQRVVQATRTFALVRNPNASGDRRAIHGRALDDNAKGQLGGIQGFAWLNSPLRPFYATRGFYWDAQKPFGPPKPIVGWRELHEVVRNGLTPLLGVALDSFNEALLRRGLEFRIPEFVRAADCVLAVAKHEGKTGFAQKAMRIAPELARSPMLAGIDIPAFLIELYERRSDCVHGRIPFEDLQTQGEAGIDRAARLEYVSEQVARSSLLAALRHPHRTAIFADRRTLEKAWKDGKLP